MKFALDTYRDIAHGTSLKRRRAIATFALWFVAGAYVTSTLLVYLTPFEGLAAEIVGGTMIALAALAVKLT